MTRHRRQARGDRVAMAAATVVVVTAWRPSAIVGVALALVAAAVLAAALPARSRHRRRGSAAIAIVLLLGASASALSLRAWAGVVPTTAGSFTGSVSVRTDPSERAGLVLFDGVELGGDGRRLTVLVSGTRRAEASELQAGDVVGLTGRVGPRRPDDDRAARRHIVGDLSVDGITDVVHAGGLSGAANRMRRLLGIGAAPLRPDDRALLAGFVLGDDRTQSARQADAFRTAGLGHLLVVSGQNVAFVLLLVRPLLQRLGTGARVAATLAVLWSFAVLTRFEPSVLRATVMAGVASVAWGAGAAIGGRRALAATVVALVVLDPLIAGSVGFVLSVAATAGIVLWSAAISSRLPGPAPVRDAAGTTLAAQVAVAPLLATIGGGTTLASIPANLLVAPIAGPLMGWGLLVGPVAGLAQEAGHGAVASGLHTPTAAGLRWIDLVADHAARPDLPEVPVVLLIATALAMVLLDRLRSPAVRRVVLAAALVPLLVTGLQPVPAPDGPCAPVDALPVWCTVDDAGERVQIVVVGGRVTEPEILRVRRSVPLRRVVVVLTSTAGAAASALDALATRAEVVEVHAPTGAERLANLDWKVVSTVTEERIGSLLLRIEPDGERLQLAVRAAPGPA